MDRRPRGAPSEDELAYVAEHLPELRSRVAANEIRSGLLLRTVGTALWTGVVVVALTQYLPDALKRKAARQLDAYAEAIEGRTGHGNPG